MKNQEFAQGLVEYFQEVARVNEICGKFAKGNVNEASLPAFWLGMMGDVESFLDENKLKVVKNGRKRSKTSD